MTKRKLIGVLLSISGFVRAEDPARSFFDWDDKTVDGFFCENSRSAFYNSLDENGDISLSKPILPPTISKEEANSVLKTGKKFSILNFGGFFETSLERVAIEEFCQDGKLKEHELHTCRDTKQKFVGKFCKDSDSEFYANYGFLKKFEEKLNKVRQEKYDRCTKHVKERMTQVMGKISKKSDSADEKDWKSELKPDRLFRGWWHELSKAFLRVCMTDVTDCARRCNYENGVCQLAKDPSADKKWVYECQCQPDYEPVVSSNTDPIEYVSELCNRTKVDAPKGSCSPLRHAKRFDMERSVMPSMTDEDDTSAVDYEFLCQSLSPDNTPWDCDHSIERENRERRAIGSWIERKEYVSQTDFGFFPWVVELNYYPSKNFKDSNAKPKEGDKDKTKGTETHMNGCSGTLVSGIDNDFIITAGHCFCTEREMGQWLVRIGIIDNTKHLNLYTGKLDDLGETDLGSEKYIDVTIEKWRIGARNDYFETGCPKFSGEAAAGYDDVAILYLNGKMSEDIRKSLQHNVRHSCISGFDNFNEMKEVDSKNLNEFYGSRCFLAGWGAANKDNEVSSMTLGIPQKSNFINVRLVPFDECKNDEHFSLRNDPSTEPYLDAKDPLFICAKGFEGSSSCQGDSGGGLFCFSEDGQSVHLLGPLHGTTSTYCDTYPDGYMYFANLAHRRYSRLIESIKKKTVRDEL